VNELVGDERVRRQPVLTSLALWCDKMLFERASLIIVVSPYLKRQLINRHDIPEDKIQIHCNAVDDVMMEKCPDVDRFIREFKLNGKFNIGFVGWFVEWHHLDVLIEVFARFCNEHPEINANLLLVGNGPLREKLVRQAEELGMAEKVTFTGTVEHSRVPEALRAMDIAIIPHSNEYRSPIKLFEYMAQGCAVVAPQTEPISMVIENGENGLLFTPLDKDQIYHSLARLATDANLRVRVGNRARENIVNRHTWRHNAQRIIDKFPGIDC
jgi:glycosyltransferase involved in cell wall biosynthesis